MHLNKYRNTALTFLMLAAGLLSAPSTATTFGLKSCGSSSPGFCGSGIVSGSLPPTHLFSFQEDGSGIIDIGAVTRNGNDIDADGLALSAVNGLIGFELTKVGSSTTASSLVSINPNTALATIVGSTLNARDIRGAVIDNANTLWAVDAANNEVLKINLRDGSLADVPLGLTFNGNPFDVSDVTDIAIRADGTFFMSSLSEIYTLDIHNGDMTFSNEDVGQAIAGIAFSTSTPENTLSSFEVNDFDDIDQYDIDSGFTRTSIYPDILSTFNSGRGDLAAITVVPVPGTIVLFTSAIAGLTVIGKKSKRSRSLSKEK